MLSDQIKENRLNNLILLAKKYSRPKLAIKLDISYNHLTQYIGKGGKTRTRNIGEDFARKIEEACGLPRYSLDQKHENIDSINKIQFIRFENIKKLIDKRFDGIVENFAKKVNITPAQLNNLIGPNTTNNISEKIARDMEIKLDLASGYLDQDQAQGGIRYFEYENFYLKHVDDILNDPDDENHKESNMKNYGKWVFDTINIKPNEGAWLVVEDDTMLPTMGKNSQVIINITNKEVISGELYAIKYENKTIVRRAFKDVDGYKFRVDSSAYEQRYKPIDINQVEVIGKIALITQPV